ncbi:hypothetical protein N7449_009498 [Penicillium cf. viridicatum]|uniref:Uncharacterized protein n=1 Tax=Penicillium cf. viridicatum TaxID=2972119 RepID=A0A9W9JCC6_9EURO|nr:hypothetical protein N7449_009498 [Penicillium cf. viridicatum]
MTSNLGIKIRTIPPLQDATIAPLRQHVGSHFAKLSHRQRPGCPVSTPTRKSETVPAVRML